MTLCLLWLLAAGAGAWGLLKYENTPGNAEETPVQWPSDSHISRQPGHFTLVMFAHPHCPCTRASVEELNRLLTRCNGPASVYVLFVQPQGVPDDWTKTGLCKTAEAIPGVAVQVDANGEEAKIFGAESSGHVVLYSPDGKLLFSGGITAARGHAGDNAGEDLVVSGINGVATPFKRTPVFGCSLQSECATPPQ